MLSKFEVYVLSKEFYSQCKRLKLPYFLHHQLLRASSSIVLNIAEGSGKRTAADQRKSYTEARGSLRECQAILEIEEVKSKQLFEMLDRLGAMLFKLTTKPQTEKPNDKQ